MRVKNAPATTKVVAAILVCMSSYRRCPRRGHEVTDLAAACKGGTHASLAAGQRMSIRDLVFAMMLPSGNDAAVMLATLVARHCTSGQCHR